MSSAASLGSGRFTAAVADLWIMPRIRQTPKAPVIFMTGGAGTAVTGPGPAWPIVTALAAAGFSVFQASVPNQLGNATALTRIANAVTFAQANGATGNPVLIGQSNGGVCALAYARANAVAAVVTAIAPVDLNYARDNDVLSTRAIIDAAWGVTWSSPGVQALPAHADPWTDRADLVGKPLQMWAASDDPFDAGANKASAYATATGAEFHNVGALGHTDPAVAAIDAATVVAFVQAHT